MNRLFIFIMAFSLPLLWSCKIDEKAKLINEIKEKKQSLAEKSAQKPANKKEVKALINLYEQFYRTYPKDTLVADYMMDAGQNAMHRGMYDKAVQCFDIVETDFSGTSQYDMAVFMKAFTYDQANDTARARVYYKKFIREFPKHKLADDALISLQNLGKSLEDIVKDLDQKKKQSK